MPSGSEYEVIMGLEIHAQLSTASKLFCSCPNRFGAPPNTQVCPVCLGMPGVLPVANRQVVEYAIMAGLATGCTITPVSRFARKNYFYPDLPKGYQISQYALPLCRDGSVSLPTGPGPKRIGITRIHVEEDPAKSIHAESSAVDETSLDFNRSGTPLIEVVTEPDLRSVDEVLSFLSIIRQTLEYLGICDCNLEEGNLRVDANISLRPRSQKQFGVKTEIKNLNSFSGVAKALEYEIERQRAVLEAGSAVTQDTYLWDSDTNRTSLMRSKEYAHDYRYFPEPDLVPVVIETDFLQKIKSGLPELPQQKKDRFMQNYQLPPQNAEVMTATRAMADYFEACLKDCPHPVRVSNWIMSEIMKVLNDQNCTIRNFRLTPVQIGGLLNLVENGTISGKIAKTVFEEMVATGQNAARIVEAKGLVQIIDNTQIEKIVDQVLAACPSEVRECRAGKTKLMGFFVGQIMKNTQGKANPKLVNEILKRKLG